MKPKTISVGPCYPIGDDRYELGFSIEPDQIPMFLIRYEYKSDTRGNRKTGTVIVNSKNFKSQRAYMDGKGRFRVDPEVFSYFSSGYTNPKPSKKRCKQIIINYIRNAEL